MQLINWIYNYCTDFMINLANLTSMSYYEVNLILFCYLFPLMLLISFLIFLIQRKRLKRLRN
jgi:hypothetical protein